MRALTRADALFLDMDGTILDIASRPDAVTVPEGLRGTLLNLRAGLGGALAILSGRKLEDIDALLGPGFACAAEHGAILRGADGIAASLAERPACFARWRDILRGAVAEMDGVLVEEKAFSLVLHYRNAPERAVELRKLAETLVTEDAEILPAHCAFELKPRGVGKGEALARFMGMAPFAGRVPVFVGDDVTDEPAIARANALGGLGLHVARDFGGDPQAVRAWLEEASSSLRASPAR